MRIPTRLITLATAAAAAASLTLAGAGAAQAETQVRNDPLGDATAFASRTASPESTADITRLTGTHGAGRLKFTFDLADLTPDEFLNTTARFASPGGRDYSVTLSRVPGQPKVVSLVRNDGDQGEQPCEGLSGSVLNAKDRIIISVPRSCVANPRSVRFGGGTVAGPALRRGIPFAYYGDDARRTGNAGGELKLGTRQLGNN